jgi:SET domain-containing protein
MKKVQYNYSPTGRGDVEVKPSGIHGLGLFAKRDLPKNFIAGQTHVLVDGDLIRTPIGGFINCSKTPNAELFQYPKLKRVNYYGVKLLMDVSEGEEITIDYNKGMSIILGEEVELINLKCQE